MKNILIKWVPVMGQDKGKEVKTWFNELDLIAYRILHDPKYHAEIIERS